MEKEYRGFKIKFDERTETWSFMDKNGQSHSDKSYKEVVNYIDKLLKKKFKRLPCYIRITGAYDPIVGHIRRYVKAEVTSITLEGSLWISTGEKREKFHGWVYALTDKNQKLIEGINKMRDQVYDLEKKMSADEQQLEKVDVDAMKRDFLKK